MRIAASLVRSALWSTLAIATVALASCSSTARQEPNETSSVSRSTLQATIVAIDSNARRVTLFEPDGARVTYQAPPDMRNFDRMQVGDRVRVTTVTERDLTFSHGGAQVGVASDATVDLAEKGALPGMRLVRTVEVTGVIVSTDVMNRTATLRFSDGSQRRMNVDPSTPMDRLRVGDDATLKVTEELEIVVEPR